MLHELKCCSGYKVVAVKPAEAPGGATQQSVFPVNRLRTENAKRGVKHVIKVKVIIVATWSQQRAA